MVLTTRLVHRSALRTFAMFAAFGLVLFGTTVPALSAEAPADDSEAEEAASDFWDAFDLFGFVNLGWGKTDGGKYRGVTEGGTADLRNAAVQLRYRHSRETEAVLQLSHERVGTSVTNEFRDDVEVDWLFVGHTFPNGLRIRLGRVPLPIGFYNEVKDVGTLLPLYRPSGNFYGEGTWTSDSVDGIVLTHGSLVGEWLISGDLYFGDWERIETDGATLTAGLSDIRNGLGFYAWLESPSGAFRVGVGANQFEAVGGAFLPPGQTDDEETRFFSMQLGTNPLRFRFEISRREFGNGIWQPYYGEIFYRFADRFSLAAVYDVGDLSLGLPFSASLKEIEELWALGVGYRVADGFQLKVEHQWVKGTRKIKNRFNEVFRPEPEKTNLLIVSVAVTF